jgi:hypothetical protein
VFMASLVHPNLQQSSIGHQAGAAYREAGEQEVVGCGLSSTTRTQGAVERCVELSRRAFRVQRVATSGTFQSIIATDASTPGYGVTKLDRQGHMMWSGGGKWGDNMT